MRMVSGGNEVKIVQVTDVSETIIFLKDIYIHQDNANKMQLLEKWDLPNNLYFVTMEDPPLFIELGHKNEHMEYFL